ELGALEPRGRLRQEGPRRRRRAPVRRVERGHHRRRARRGQSGGPVDPGPRRRLPGPVPRAARAARPAWHEAGKRGGARSADRLASDPGCPARGSGHRGHHRESGGTRHLSIGWWCVLVVGLATVAIKASGPVLAAGRELPEPTARVVDLLAPAVLAALGATQAFASADTLA